MSCIYTYPTTEEFILPIHSVNNDSDLARRPMTETTNETPFERYRDSSDLVVMKRTRVTMMIQIRRR